MGYKHENENFDKILELSRQNMLSSLSLSQIETNIQRDIKKQEIYLKNAFLLGRIQLKKLDEMILNDDKPTITNNKII